MSFVSAGDGEWETGDWRVGDWGLEIGLCDLVDLGGEVFYTVREMNRVGYLGVGNGQNRIIGCLFIVAA